MSNKKYLIMLAIASVLAGTFIINSTSAQAATSGQGWSGTNAETRQKNPGVFGTVTAIDGTTITITSKAMPSRNSKTSATATAATTYSIDASNATVTKNNTTAAVSNIAIGDTIMVQGKRKRHGR